MDLHDNYIITSDEGVASDFSASFASAIRVEEGHKLALKNIFYGPIFNVTNKNNLLLVEHKTKKESASVELFVTPNHYANILSLTMAISRTINNWIDTKHVFCVELNATIEHCKVDYDPDTDTIELELAEHLSLINSSKPNVLNLIDLGEEERFAGYEVKNGYFTNYYPAFVYASVVENSYINNFPSRLLAVVPMQSGFVDGDKTGYHYHEFTTPTYFKFAIREFSQIFFQIRDLDGEILEFDPGFKTILSLEVFKPLNIL